MKRDAEAFVAALPEHVTGPTAPRAPTVTVPIRHCLGIARSPATDPSETWSVVLQRADGGLHVLTMDIATAVAIALAVRADIRL